MARKIDVSLTPMNIVKGSRASFPYLIDREGEKVDFDFVEGSFEGTTNHKNYSIEMQLSRKVNNDGSFRVYFNASKVFESIDSTDCDRASDFVMCRFGSLFVNDAEEADKEFPAYFIDENGHVHMRTDLFERFLNETCNFSDVVEKLEYKYKKDTYDL